MSVLSSVRDIASLAYGSGAFEGAKGGEGYMGAFVDSTTGQVRVVKMLTHRSEYGAVKKAGGEERFAAEHANLAESTQTLKNTLLDIARMHGDETVVNEVTDLLQGKPLLSRKIVAQVVNVLTRDVDSDDFSWRGAAEQAKTMKDTTLDSVMNENSRIDRNEKIDGDGARFKSMGFELEAEIKGTVGNNLEECAEKVLAGRFDRGWRKAFGEVAVALSEGMNRIFRNEKVNFLDTVDINAIRLNDTESMMGSASVKIFHRVLRKVIADSISRCDAFPLNDTQKLRIMARAFKKAYIISLVKAAADKMIDMLEYTFQPGEMYPNRKKAIQTARERLNSLDEFLDGYEKHFGFEAMNWKNIYPGSEIPDAGTLLARWVMSTDAISAGDLPECCEKDLTNVNPIRDSRTKSIGEAIGDVYDMFGRGDLLNGKNVIVKQLNNFITYFVPRSDAQGLDVAGELNKQQYDECTQRYLFDVKD